MGAGLVRENVGDDTALGHLGDDVGAIPDESDREPLAFAARVVQPAERLIELVRDPVAVTGRDPLFDPRGIDIDP